MTAPMFARRSGPERKICSGISGSRLRDSIAMKAASPAATSANDPMVRAEAQPACCADTTVYTSSSMLKVTVNAPGRSNDRRLAGALPVSRASRGISHQPAASTTSATGAGTSRVQRQLTAVSRPDSTRPRENPLPPKAE